MSRETFLDSDDDMQWLFATCLRGVPLPSAWHGCQSAVLAGNEDAPDSVQLYMAREPMLSDDYIRVTFNHEAPIYCEWALYSGASDTMRAVPVTR